MLHHRSAPYEHSGIVKLRTLPSRARHGCGCVHILLTQLFRVSALYLDLLSGSAIRSYLYDASCSLRCLQVGMFVAGKHSACIGCCSANGLAQVWVAYFAAPEEGIQVMLRAQ